MVAAQRFEITDNDIARLNDDDLRSLVGRLCESEARRRGLPSSSVTWGGNQTAADGGLDVCVALPPDTAIDGFVPRPATGFQVKKPDIPRSAILKEMRPSGVLRAAIRELADESGAYIIVSSTGSTSYTVLQNRRKAMAEAVNDLPNRSSLTLDFYDRTRLATWVRDHPGLIPWMRTKVGKDISGWSSYGPWAYEPDGTSGEYLLDEKLRIHTQKNDSESGCPPLEGIKQMRDLLRDPGNVVRLIGLSGVGKTRLLQALFDDRIGEKNLDPSLAIYTNMADEPDPQPTGLASDLIADRTRAIVVIDNCPPELHRRISELCRSSESTVSAITVEYDIREDQPEGTEVFRLEPASIGLIEKLVQHRSPALSTVDSRTIAEFSGGNARIGIALASTVSNNETIAGLSDEELFQRLFQQRHAEDEPLLLVAQACSLVYSFQGQDVSNGDQAELVRLGSMIGENAQEVFRGVAELQRRDLVQQRSVWRAVLPHAIANRLAALALQNVPFATIEAQLVKGAPERLLKSFSRRLGYLHGSKEAVAIVEKWLATDGLLGNVANLNEVGEAMLNNVAPAAPEAALAAFERALFGPESDNAVVSCAKYVRLIRSLAHDPPLFERCTALLLKFAEETGEDGKSNSAASVFASLFFLYLSGTHATIEQRLRVIEPLLLSDDTNQSSLGLKALKAALETGPFTSDYQFEFGARSRDHGYWPRTGNEVKHWYGSVLKLAETSACCGRPIAPLVCAAVGREFRGLWNLGGMYDELEDVCHTISGRKFWPEGWIAVRETLNFDSERFTPQIVARLSLLEKRLRPTDLVQKVRAIVLSDMQTDLDLDDFEEKSVDDPEAAMRRTEAIARSLGEAVATDAGAFDELLGELVSGRGRLTSFGQGLLEGTLDPKATWDRLVAQLATKREGEQNVQILVGFLSALNVENPQLAETLLDDAVKNETLAALYPWLQVAMRIDAKGLDRIRRSLALGRTPIGRYEVLAWGGAPDQISAQDLKELVLTIAAKPEGFRPALEILGMRLYSDDRRKQGHAAEIIDAGRELLRQLRFTKKTDREDHRLEAISKACLVGEEGAEVARGICRKLKDSVAKYETYSFNNGGLLQGLLGAQPAAVLDSLCSGDAAEIKQGIRILEDGSRHSKNLLDVVSEGDLLDWCDKEPNSRYAIVAAGITWSLAAEESGARRWTNIALAVLKKAPDRAAVLKEFVRRFSPMSWSGSRATIMAANVKLLDELEGYSDPTVIEFIAREKVLLNKEIEAERRAETLADRAHDERFE
jgi:hypothetical protein